MSKKRCHHSAAVVRLRVHRWEEDFQVVLPGEDSPEQNSMLTRRVSNKFISRKFVPLVNGYDRCGSAKKSVTDHVGKVCPLPINIVLVKPRRGVGV